MGCVDLIEGLFELEESVLKMDMGTALQAAVDEDLIKLLSKIMVMSSGAEISTQRVPVVGAAQLLAASTFG